MGLAIGSPSKLNRCMKPPASSTDDSPEVLACSSVAELPVMYADDCNIYVRSERAGRRVMESITRFITNKLKLKVNETKSALARPQERKLFGFSFASGSEVKRAIAPKALNALRGESVMSQAGQRA